MVHGSIADHTTFDPLVAALRDRLHHLRHGPAGLRRQRRHAPYAIERDFEDVAAVVDAVAARTGGPVALWGHSYGANSAMGAAARSDHVDHLVLYEPSLGLTYPPGSIDADRGRRSPRRPRRRHRRRAADILEMTDEEIDAFRASPQWPAPPRRRPDPPPGVPGRGELGVRTRAVRRDHRTALLLAGSDSVAALGGDAPAAAAIPDARIHVLEGHGHFAHKTDPAIVATIIQSFVADAAW